MTVLLYVKDGRKPQRPTEITVEAYWDLIGRCWAEAAERPTARSLLQDVQRLLFEAEFDRHFEEEQNKREREEQRRKEDLEHKRREDEKRASAVVPLRLSSATTSVVKGFRPRVGKALNSASSTAITRLSIPSSLSLTQEVEPGKTSGKEVWKNADQDNGKKTEAQRRKAIDPPPPPTVSIGKVGFKSRVGRAMRSSSFSSISQPHSLSPSTTWTKDFNQAHASGRLSSKLEGKQARKDPGDQGRQIESPRAKHLDTLYLPPPTTTGLKGLKTRMGNVVRRSSSFTTTSQPRTPSPSRIFIEDGDFPRISPTTPSGIRGFRTRVGGVLKKNSISSIRSAVPPRSSPSPCPSIGLDIGDYLFEAKTTCDLDDVESARREEQGIDDSPHLSSPAALGSKSFRSRVGRMMRKRSSSSAMSRPRTSSVASSLYFPEFK